MCKYLIDQFNKFTTGITDVSLFQQKFCIDLLQNKNLKIILEVMTCISIMHFVFHMKKIYPNILIIIVNSFKMNLVPWWTLSAFILEEELKKISTKGL